MRNRTSKIKRRAIIIVGTSVFILVLVFLISPYILSFKIAKDINEAFEILDHKLSDRSTIVTDDIAGVYIEFERKKEVFLSNGKDISMLEFWEDKALKTKKESAKMRGFILHHSNEMIKLAENKDWVMKRDEDGNIESLLPLNELSKMDDTEIPTNYFLGISNYNFKPDPNAAGPQLLDSIKAFRKLITEEMGTYELDGVKYLFKAPDDIRDLQAAFKTCNSKDTARIGAVYRLLSYPDKATYKNNVADEEIPYVSIMFYQTPITAACAILTSLTVDVRIAEKMVADYYLSKIGY
jgi:hypothetical protein